MKLYLTNRSPFARKAVIMAIEKGLESKIKIIPVDLANKPKELIEANPLGQVPTLVLENGHAIYDSPVICEYIDGLNDNPKLIPSQISYRIEVLRTEALTDGMVESAIKIYFENNKPSDKKDETTLRKYYEILDRGFDMLDRICKTFHTEQLFTLAEISTASALGYISFRLTDYKWREKHAKLATWFDKFSERESLKKTMPKV
ncbi:MAG: glutathione S-transferase N-terminal domain-containing protein [Rickettsiales bacterium]|nr:glutathione S-transferase N-terminal domain-containing protein [Rickettsiales bacterium]